MKVSSLCQSFPKQLSAISLGGNSEVNTISVIPLKINGNTVRSSFGDATFPQQVIALLHGFDYVF
jgi:hypothetical protein